MKKNPGKRRYHIQVTLQKSGNRCGHQPLKPRFFNPPQNHKRRPGILQELEKRARRYYFEPKFFPTLNSVNGSPRQQRSERREACILLLSTLIHFLDLCTLCVCIPKSDGTIQGISLITLARLAGLNLRRAERAMHDLVGAGIVSVKQNPKIKQEGGYKSQPAVRTISTAVIRILGLSRWLQREREKAVRRKKQTWGLAHIGMALKAVLSRASSVQNAKPKGKVITSTSRDEMIRKLRQLAKARGETVPDPPD